MITGMKALLTDINIGSGKCDGNDVSGTVCMPFTNSVGGPAGEYSVVQWLRKGVLEGFGVVGLGL